LRCRGGWSPRRTRPRLGVQVHLPGRGDSRSAAGWTAPTGFRAR
jgi:hypothetical protein